jgi:hypothetical protein
MHTDKRRSNYISARTVSIARTLSVARTAENAHDDPLYECCCAWTRFSWRMNARGELTRRTQRGKRRGEEWNRTEGEETRCGDAARAGVTATERERRQTATTTLHANALTEPQPWPASRDTPSQRRYSPPPTITQPCGCAAWRIAACARCDVCNVGSCLNSQCRVFTRSWRASLPVPFSFVFSPFLSRNDSKNMRASYNKRKWILGNLPITNCIAHVRRNITCHMITGWSWLFWITFSNYFIYMTNFVYFFIQSVYSSMNFLIN